MNEGERKSLEAEVGNWIWGTIQGGFNEQQTISQIVVDAAIGMVPVVGDVTAVRDLLATVLRLVDHPEKREEKLEWLTLVLLLFALIPVAGGAIKGVGRLLLKAGAEAGEHAQLLRRIIQYLNRVGEGNAVKFIKNLNLEKYAGELRGHWRQVVQRFDEVLGAILRRAGSWMSDGMVRRIQAIQKGIRELRAIGERMIPESLKELNARLKTIQRHLHSGDWHEIPSSLKSATREAEARLVEREIAGEKKLAWEGHDLHFPPNSADDFHPVAGWPNLRKGKWLHRRSGEAWAVATFSGPIRPVKIPVGTKLRRIVDETSNVAGPFWMYELPKNGRSWRQDCAVLEAWNKNGRYVEFVVPEPGLIAWEGRSASQMETDVSKATAGQHLKGGGTQLLIDFDFPANQHVLESRNSWTIKETGWVDVSDINVPEKGVTVQQLGMHEVEPKTMEIVAEGAGLGQRAARSRSRAERNAP